MVGKENRLAECRGCGAQICFIKTVKGKSMPVDPLPMKFVPGGGPETYVTEEGEVKRGRAAGWDSKYEKTLIGYRSHFATCPAADEFRKKNKSERNK